MVLGDGFAEFRGRQRLAIGDKQRRKLELLTFRARVSSCEVLRRRRVCDAGPQTGLRPHSRAFRRPRGIPRHQTSCPPMPCRNTSSPLALSFIFRPNAAHGTKPFRPFMLKPGSRLAERARTRGGSRCHCKLPRPDDFRIFSQPAAKDTAEGFFLRLLRPHRSSLEPGPAKELLHTVFNTPISPMFAVVTAPPSFDTLSSAGLLFTKKDDRFHSFGLLSLVQL